MLACVSVINTGCYVYQPLNGLTPAVGEQVELTLTDSGRVALGSQLGPGVLHVDGLLRQVGDGAYEIGVYRLSTISGETSDWAGERVRIPVSVVSQMGIRKLSKTRTVLIAAVVAVGLGVFIATRSLSIGGGSSRDTSGTGGPPPKT